MGCGGVDQILEKMPVLKEETPMLLKTTKETIVAQIDSIATYFSSFSLVLLALKVVDFSLTTLEESFVYASLSDGNKLATGVKMVHEYANAKKTEGFKAGSEMAKRIEDTSVIGAFLEVIGLGNLLGTAGVVKVKTEMDETDPVVDNTDVGLGNLLGTAGVVEVKTEMDETDPVVDNTDVEA